VAARHIRLVCWKPAEAEARASRLRAAGYEVAIDPLSSIVGIRKLRPDPPAAVVIDLGRLPSQGCSVGLAIRAQKGTRQVPLAWTIAAPDDFPALVSPLLAGVILRRVRAGRLPAQRGSAGKGAPDLLVWFVRTGKELESRIVPVARVAAASGGLWIAWRKKASGRAGDVSFREVQRAGLSHGLVDFKIIAVDDTWSALRFAVRRASPRPGRRG